MYGCDVLTLKYALGVDNISCAKELHKTYHNK